MKAIASLPLALLLVAAPVRAESPPPERLLSAGTQVYLRWDGIPAHRDAYAQTALGKLVQGELAPLVKALVELYPKTLQSSLTESKLLDGESPAKLARIHTDVVAAGKLLDVLADHGVVVGLEIAGLPSVFDMAVGGFQSAIGKKPERNPFLPRVQATVIVPGGADKFASVQSLLRLYASGENYDSKEEKVAGRTVLHIAQGEVHWLTWTEGAHIVLAIGTELPAAVMARIDGPGPKLEASPLYQRVRDFGKFRTDIRAFVDTRSLAGLARTGLGLVSFAAARHFDAVGLEGVHSVVYYSGFEGHVRRELIEADMPGPRKGLGNVFGSAPLTWDRLPPLPPDVSRFSANRLNPTALYELLVKGAELANVANPDAAGDSQAEELDKLAGIALKTDLLEHLGDCVVTYHSPAEGAIMFGQVVAVEVKDGAKVLNALDQVVEARTGANVKLKRRPVRDGEIREIYVRQPGFIFVPSYAVYKNWLVMSFYPQPLQGFIQRMAGDVPAWQPDDGVKAGFAALPGRATGLAMSDPRPAVQQVLNFAPIIIEAALGFSQGGSFEVGTLPSASVLNRHLTPNVTVQTDDGKTLRWESRGSVLMLGDFLGIDPLALFLLTSIAG